MPGKRREPARPSGVLGGVGLSLGLHAVLASLLWLPALARHLLPRAPIEMTLLPRRPAAPAVPAVPAADAPADPAPPPAPAPSAKAARPRPRPRATSKAAQTQADLDGLSALYGDTALVAVIVRADLLRQSPHRPAALRLLGAFPDTRLLAAASGQDVAALTRWLVDETAGLLVLSSDLSSLTATNLVVVGSAGRGGLLARAGVAGTGLGGDPRRLEALSPQVAVYARPEFLSLWRQQAAAEGAAFARRVRAPLTSGAALTLVAHRADELLRLAGLPTPRRLVAQLSADAAPRLQARLQYADATQAAIMAQALPQRLGALAGTLVWLGLQGLVTGLQIEQAGAQVRVSGLLPSGDVDRVLDLLAMMMPAAPGLPPPSASPAPVEDTTEDGGAP